MKSAKNMIEPVKRKQAGVEIRGGRRSWKDKLLANLFPFKNPPIILLSYPRSGSTWVGDVLSKSDSVAYLCDPITQPYLMKEGGKYALVDVNNDSLAFSIYAKLGDDIFRGVPPAHSGVVADLHEFSIFQRINRHILIKEVNPRAAEFYCARYGPKILFLLRHPAAVALSFSQQGWLDSPDTQLETGNSDASVWERFGFAYGSIMKNALEVIKSSDHEVLMYEDLALNSEREFEKLFRLLGLKRPKNYKAIMQR